MAPSGGAASEPLPRLGGAAMLALAMAAGEMRGRPAVACTAAWSASSVAAAASSSRGSKPALPSARTTSCVSKRGSHAQVAAVCVASSGGTAACALKRPR